MERYQTCGARLAALSLAGASLGLVLAGCSKSEQASIDSARAHLQRKEVNAAVIELKNALQANANSGEARFLLGSVMLDAKNPQGASFQLQKAVDLKYAAPQLVPRLAQAMLLSGDFKGVVQRFGATRLPAPEDDASLQTTIATAFASQDDKPAARAALADALRRVPDYDPARLVEARLAATTGDFEGGLHTVNAVLAHHADNADALLLRGELLLRRDGRPSDESVAAFEHALAADPQLIAAQATLTLVALANNDLANAAKQLTRMKTRFPTDSRTIYLQAQLDYQNAAYAAAAETANRLLKGSPTNPTYLTLAGASELHLREFQSAETHLKQALQSSPDQQVNRQLLAQLYLSSGQAKQALDVLEPLLSAPASAAPSTLALAGQASLQLGRYTDAESQFEKASRQTPTDVPIRTALAITRLSRGETEAAFADLAGIAATDRLASADLALITARMRRKEYEQALSAIEVLARKQPASAQPPYLRGKVLLALGKNDAARTSFEDALKIDALYFSAVTSLAWLDLKADKSEDATRRVQEFLKRDPKNVQVLLAIAELSQRAGAKPEKIEATLEKAVELSGADATPRVALVELLLSEGKAKEALGTAQAAVAVLPESAAALDSLGRAQIATGENNQALSTYRKLASLQPDSPLADLRIADIELSAKNYEPAAQSLRRALSVTPTLLGAQQGLIAIEDAGGRQSAALEIAKTIQRQRPADAVGFMLEGDVESSRKNWVAAARAFRAGFNKQGDERNAVKLHALLLGTGQRAEADRMSLDWMRDHPKDTFFLTHLGEQAIVNNDMASAERLYRQVLAVLPNNAAAHNNLAWALAKQQRPGAVAEAERADSLSPNQAAILETLAFALSQEKQLPKAIEVQRRAATLAPGMPTMRLDLARLYLQSGDKELARKELDDLAKLGKSFPRFAEVDALRKTL